MFLENDRKFYYETNGNAKGQPIIFLHGAIPGTRFLVGSIRYLRTNNLKIIAPHRACFSKSDIHLTIHQEIGYINDITHLLKVEKLDKFFYIGHHTGAYYSYLFAKRMPKKILNLKFIGGAIPFRNAKQISEMIARQRIITYTARYAPKLLPFLLQGVIAQVKKNGFKNMMSALFGNNGPVMNCAKR